MNTNTTNEGVMNNSSQPSQNGLFQIDKEIQKLRQERGEVNSEFIKKIKGLENKRNELQINLFPIKKGDEVITKQMYKIFNIIKKGKTDRSISFEMVDKDYIKGKVFYVYNGSYGNDCEIVVHFDLEDDGYTTDLLLENDGLGESPKIVSLDRFNELYEVVNKTIKN